MLGYIQYAEMLDVIINMFKNIRLWLIYLYLKKLSFFCLKTIYLFSI